MSYRYHLHFKAAIDKGVTEAARIVTLDCPIQFDSDLLSIRDFLVKDLGAADVLILSWRPLLGEIRPAELMPAAPAAAPANPQDVAKAMLDQALAGTQKGGKAPAKSAAKKPAGKAAAPSRKPARKAAA